MTPLWFPGGRLLSWGWNEHGMCGDGSHADVVQPQRVPSLRPLLIGCGAGHSLAVCATVAEPGERNCTWPHFSYICSAPGWIQTETLNSLAVEVALLVLFGNNFHFDEGYAVTNTAVCWITLSVDGGGVIISPAGPTHDRQDSGHAAGSGHARPSEGSS